MDKLQKPMKQNFAAHRVFISSSCNYEHPLVSVVIPTLNRCKALSYLLDSIAKQTIEPNLFEVIAVDNGSVDSTIDVLDSFVKIMPNIRYYHDPSPGLHVGRHKGLKEAKTDILVYVDDDSLPTPSWLEGVLDSFIDERVVLVGGKVLPKFEAPPLSGYRICGRIIIPKARCWDISASWISEIKLKKLILIMFLDATSPYANQFFWKLAVFIRMECLTN